MQSNHCRQTAAAAAANGLRCVLVLRGHKPVAATGNLLLDHLLGATIVFAGDRTREEGRSWPRARRRPASVPHPGGRIREIGAMGYVAAMEEVVAQLAERRVAVDRVELEMEGFPVAEAASR